VLVNFGESVNFPVLFGAALSVFGVATLVHLLPVPALLAARSQPRELLRTE
jgi:peptide subunit release factor RF-3